VNRELAGHMRTLNFSAATGILWVVLLAIAMPSPEYPLAFLAGLGVFGSGWGFFVTLRALATKLGRNWKTWVGVTFITILSAPSSRTS
jgi:hypothetical protein